MEKIILNRVFLVKKDSLIIPENEEEIRLFVVVRNEMLRLPYFFKYYRLLGVDRFFVIDNASTDNTCQFLLAQENTHVFYTEDSFCNKEFWLKHLMDRYGLSHWCVVVDADELFQYPYFEKVGLHSFCDFLDFEGSTAIENLLVDMYPEAEVECNRYEMGDSLLENSSFFDPYCYERVSCLRKHILLGDYVPMTAYMGGTRKRIFEINKLCCSKYSLIKYSPEILLDAGMHFILGAQISGIQGVVLHFKFLYDFFSRVNEEVMREEHFQKAKEYKLYQKKLSTGLIGSLYHSNSIKYEGSQQLLELGFMKSNIEYNKYSAYLL